MKKERGAITLIALVTILFMIAFLISTFAIIMNRRQAQAELKRETKGIYESDVENVEQVYKDYFADENMPIPINIAENLPKIGTGKYIVVDGKIYKCTKDAEYNFATNLEWTAYPTIYGNSQVISSNVESVGEKVIDSTDSNYGKYRIPIVVTGKNLIDYTKIFTGKGLNGNYYSIDLAGTVTCSLSAYNDGAGSDVFFLTPGTYSISADVKKTEETADSFWGFVMFKIPIETPKARGTEVEDSILSSTLELSSTEFTRLKKEKTIITEPGYYSVRVQMEKTGTIFKNLQIERGDTATAYEEYNGKIVNIYLDEPLRKVGDYVDYLDLKTGKVIRNVEVASESGATVETALKGLSTPKTEIITVPEEVKGKGNQILRIETTVQPSKVNVTYK